MDNDIEECLNYPKTLLNCPITQSPERKIVNGLIHHYSNLPSFQKINYNNDVEHINEDLLSKILNLLKDNIERIISIYKEMELSKEWKTMRKHWTTIDGDSPAERLQSMFI